MSSSRKRYRREFKLEVILFLRNFPSAVFTEDLMPAIR